jgi:inner membrane protein
MLLRTHLVVTIFVILLLLSYIENKILFVVVALMATLLPDIDTRNSKLGHKFYFRPLQWFVKHRGFFHSFSFLILVILIFVFFIPVLALGFFVGYASHLFLDSFTLEGVRLFYPLKIVSCGNVKTGGIKENVIFIGFLVVDVLFLIFKFS